MPEIFTYSSNIGTARMALSLGVEHHKSFLRKMGQLDRLRTELAGKRRAARAQALGRAQHRDHRVRPRALGRAAAGGDGIGALMNGGQLIPPTFLKRSEQEAAALAKQVVKPETSEKMRYLMRLNAEKGTASKADVKGYYVGGKTGTSEKVVGGRYSKTKLLTTFTAVLPADKPRYLLLIMLDEPQPTAGNPRLRHVGLERGAGRRRGHRPHRAAARDRAAVRSAGLGEADSGQRGRALS